MNVPTVLPELATVAARYPRLRIIIDHMGRLRGMKDVSFKLDKTIALAKYPNVHVKLTLLQECYLRPLSIQQYPTRGAPTNRRLFAASVILGHGYFSALLSRSPVTYRQAVIMFTEEMGFSQGDLEWIMGRAISECLPWPVAPTLARAA